MTSNEIIYKTELPLINKYILYFYVRWYWKECRKSYQFILKNHYDDYVVFGQEKRTIDSVYNNFMRHVDSSLLQEYLRPSIVDGIEFILNRHDIKEDEDKKIFYRYGV